jgi:hypothetical protein
MERIVLVLDLALCSIRGMSDDICVCVCESCAAFKALKENPKLIAELDRLWEFYEFMADRGLFNLSRLESREVLQNDQTASAPTVQP